jgi:hypothetical protein
MKKFFLFVMLVTAALFFVNERFLLSYLSLFAAGAVYQMPTASLCIKGIVFDNQATNFAHGIAPDFTSALAELMAPQCVQPAASGQYVQFDDDEAFRYIETRRALGGDMAMIDMPSDSPTFNCNPHALGIPTDSFERERVGDAGLQMLRESKIQTLVSRNALSREKRVFAAYEAGVAAQAGPGDWTDPDVDPIEELDEQVSTLASETGNANIDLVFGLPAMKQIRKHPKVKAYFPGVEVMAITPERIAQLLILPVRIHVGILPIAMEKTGRAAAKVNIVGSRIYALLSQKNPSPYDPSAAKTFTTRLGQVDGVGFVERPPFAEINFMAWSEDIKITGSKCVRRIDVTTGAIA